MLIEGLEWERIIGNPGAQPMQPGETGAVPQTRRIGTVESMNRREVSVKQFEWKMPK